ncbi:hypothetical protein CSH63_17770 [Micromonospora tulbaghiae]|uniref:Uncharacterized protein n=1 Tax=Micromonospora tulbaghiae TaxID=479978 RepID=A0A386WPD8_9ACTN|nr:hypothetical protein [Micromonospora tulbaghiae]AYF29279.1 hypothetical protein CSH63_17770 [Micromonospora tulbaghiae]
MTAAVGPQASADADACRGCSHGQGSHKRGKGGCREVDCACGKYEVDPRAQRAERERVLTAVAEVCERQAVKARGELAAMPVAADRVAEVAAHVDGHRVAEIERLAGELAEERREHQATALRLGQAYERVDELTAERNEARAELANLCREVIEREEQIARERGARMAELVQLRAEVELDRATAAGRRVQVPAADGEVVSRYAAYLCLACSARYGKPFTDHGCGPLVPVVVTIARADRPGSDTSKEKQPS